jgi:hypothetical protein
MNFFDLVAKFLSTGGIKVDAKKVINFEKISILNNLNIGTKTTTIDNRTLIIDYSELSEKERRDLLSKQIPQQFKNGIPILEQGFYENVDKYKETVGTDVNKELISYFTGKLPNEDIIVLKASIYLKEVLVAGGDSDSIKQEIIQRYGTRGKNISNLYTAGYFTSWIKPLYEELTKSNSDSMATKKKFCEIYQEIVKYPPFALFIHRSMTPLEIEREIKNKISHLNRYGIKTLNIHAIGHRNIETTNKVIKKLEKSIKFKKEEVKEDAILVIKLMIL